MESSHLKIQVAQFNPKYSDIQVCLEEDISYGNDGMQGHHHQIEVIYV